MDFQVKIIKERTVATSERFPKTKRVGLGRVGVYLSVVGENDKEKLTAGIKTCAGRS